MATPSDLVGTWTLQAWTIAQPDGTVVHPYGEGAVGFLIYTADGYMSAQIMDPDRQQGDAQEPTADQSLSEPDGARAYSTYLAYCGTFTLEGHVLTHHVKAGLEPGWTGSDQVRPFRFEDGRLVIAAGAHTLVWERAVPRA